MGVAPDPLMAALERLEEVIDANNERAKLIKARIETIRAAHAEGRGWADIVTGEPAPLIVQLVSDSAQELDEHGAHLRRVEALTLYNEGLTMEHIAALFGVSRQRVSALLKASSG